MSDETPPCTKPDCDCRLFCDLLGGMKFKGRSRRQLLSAIDCFKNHDSAALVLQAGPGVHGRWDVIYGGVGGIKEVIFANLYTVFPQLAGQREGRNAGRS